ncbi:MAG: GatB/YqeY domain-containing protein [Candidatus Paceibacterota bacterium]
MELEYKIKEDLKEAIKCGDNFTRDVLRFLTSDIKNEGIRTREELDDKEVLAVVRKNIKSRKDSVEQFTKGGRADLAEKEKAELVVLEKYVPSEMSEDEIAAVVRRVLEKTDAEATKNFGLVMKEVMKEIDGRADGAVVGGIVKKTLID